MAVFRYSVPPRPSAPLFMISRLAGDRFRSWDGAGDLDDRERSRRANRRRLVVFLSVFVVLATIGLVWDFSRPAIYEASSLLDFVGSNAPAGDDRGAGDKRYTLRDEIQYLTSTTLLATVWDGLKGDPATPASVASGDPATNLQAMTAASQVSGTNVVSVRAQGADPAFLAKYVNRLVDAYRASLGERFRSGSTTAIAEAQDEANKLDVAVTGKRLEIDAFRAKNNIVSLERDENQVLSEVRGTSAALNDANAKVAAADAKLASLREAEAQGRSVSRAADNPTLASLEQAAAAIRADLRETARTFTAEYMNIDPRIKSLRARLADLEEQIGVQRKASAQGAIQEAAQEAASARSTANALRQQLAANQNTVQSFTSHFNEYRAKQEELTHLEQLKQKAADRLALLQANEQGRQPKVDVIETASTPQSPARPLYARDALIVVLGAIGAGLVTMGIVELFNRPPRQATTVVVPQPVTTVAMGPLPSALAMDPRGEALPGPRDASRALADDRSDEPAGALPAPVALPRELTGDETVALLEACEPRLRGTVALLLSGLTVDELTALARDDVRIEPGAAHGTVRIGGADARTIAMPAALLRRLVGADDREDPVPAAGSHDGSTAALATDTHGRAPTAQALATAILYAAHDAGLDDPDRVTPDALRHTYLAFLARQGLRFSEIARLAGTLPADRLSAYRRLAAERPAAVPRPASASPATADARTPADVASERLLPAVRALG